MSAKSTSKTHREQVELNAFARALHEKMAEQGVSASELARRVWGEHTDKRGYRVATNRDRKICWFL